MKVHPIIFGMFIWIAIPMTKGEQTRKNVILNEIQIAPASKFIELQSEESGVALDGYSLVVMDISKERSQCGSEPRVKVRGALSLHGKRTDGHYAFVGKCLNCI